MIAVAPPDLHRAFFDLLLEPDDVVEERACDEARGNRLQGHEQRVHQHDPERSVVVEDALGNHEPERQVMERHRRRRNHDDHRVGEHRQHRQDREEVEVHLDLHGPLADVHEHTAQAHRGEAVHERTPTLGCEDAMCEHRRRQHHRRQQGGERRPRIVHPRDQHEDRQVGTEEHPGDAVDASQVAGLERRHLPRQHERMGHAMPDAVASTIVVRILPLRGFAHVSTSIPVDRACPAGSSTHRTRTPATSPPHDRRAGLGSLSGPARRDLAHVPYSRRNRPARHRR